MNGFKEKIVETMVNETENAFFAELEKNIADEAEARHGYYMVLTKFGFLMEEKDVRDFEEIIAEELKHSEMLSEMIRRRNKIEAER